MNEIYFGIGIFFTVINALIGVLILMINFYINKNPESNFNKLKHIRIEIHDECDVMLTIIIFLVFIFGTIWVWPLYLFISASYIFYHCVFIKVAAKLDSYLTNKTE